VLGYFLLIPPFLTKKCFKCFYPTIRPVRFHVMTFLLLAMAALPIKMVLRWLFNLKYIIGIPEYFFNICRHATEQIVSSETPNEGGHKKPPIPTPAKKIPALNIEKRGDRLYEVIYLHKWFAISSILLFLFTVAMVLVDYSREWKRYQREFVRLQIQRTERDRQQVLSSLDRAKFQQLQQQLQQARAQQQQNEAQIDKIQK